MPSKKLYFNLEVLVFNYFLIGLLTFLYCKYGNLDLLTFIVHLLINFYSYRWLLESAAKILVDFSETYHHCFY